MTGGLLLITFSSLVFAASFLALVMVMTDHDPREIAATVSAFSPAKRRQARWAQLDEMTRIADTAIEARRLGKRLTRDDAGL